MKLSILMVPRFALAIWHTVVWAWQSKPIIAPKTIQDHRLLICSKCEHYIASSEQCGKCLCFVSIKSVLSSEHCPDNPARWKTFESDKVLTDS